MNEGATKGILVTTSDYGPDAYEFANGKPITLLNGAHVLRLLERHGTKAHINLVEARQIVGGPDTLIDRAPGVSEHWKAILAALPQPLRTPGNCNHASRYSPKSLATSGRA